MAYVPVGGRMQSATHHLMHFSNCVSMAHRDKKTWTQVCKSCRICCCRCKVFGYK